jgi:signal transduction histidine kinase
VDERPDAAGELLSSLEEQAQEAVVNVRRVVQGLRPPALDDLGLVPAIRQQAAAYGMTGGTADVRGPGISLTVEAPEPFPALPAATEVALYRIAQEALTNVARHSGAASCRVSLRVPGDGTLEIEVSDDGRGVGGDTGSGMGLISMRERAEELGGTCEVSTPPGGGTSVIARLPVAPTEYAGDGQRSSEGESGA